MKNVRSCFKMNPLCNACIMFRCYYVCITVSAREHLPHYLVIELDMIFCNLHANE